MLRAQGKLALINIGSRTYILENIDTYANACKYTHPHTLYIRVHIIYNTYTRV